MILHHLCNDVNTRIFIYYKLYCAKRWRWKTLANPTENHIGKKILANASPTSNETLLAKNVGNYVLYV